MSQPADAQNLDLAVIGNCQFSALVDRRGSVVWACFPRFDSPSVFASLLDSEIGGAWTIEAIGEGWRTECRYLETSCILSTRWFREGSPDSFEVLDFAPRFSLYDRVFRPPILVRLVRNVHGRPRVRVVCAPRFEYGRRAPYVSRGSNHITYEDTVTYDKLRLTTDASVTHITEGRPFELSRNLHFALAWGEPFEDTFAKLSDFLIRTHEYWRDWCKNTRIPVNYQDAVLRAAMTLKLHQFEDTGAVIAATTTSIPEADGTGRNWDYRYCWVRDAAFVVRALLRLGHSGDAQRFCEYLRNLVPADQPDAFSLQPVYGVDGREDLTETTLDHLAGYRENKPVRIGNEAYTHCQNDVYGELVLALSPLFYDERLLGSELAPVYDSIENLVSAALRTLPTEDASIWEYRGRMAHHVFSKFMGWVALDRGARIAERVGQPEKAVAWRTQASRVKEELSARGYSERLRAFVGVYDTEELDASVLLMSPLRFLPPGDPRILSTIDTLRRELGVDGFMFRYRRDDMGEQRSAFTICSTWMIEALWLAGRRSEAAEMFEHLLSARNSFGLLSEDIDPRTGELWGNFPQTYSMLGIINCAVRLSPTWDEIF